MLEMTPRELGQAIGVDPKRIRAWLREIAARSDVEHGQPWHLGPDLIAATCRRFERSAAGLREWRSSSADLAEHRREGSRAIAAGPPFQAAESALLSDASFQSVHRIRAVPEQLGLYAIRVTSADALPDPFRRHALNRNSRLIYIGEATKQTLGDRLTRNELGGRGHGTFFRSIGAVLGYRPLPGSLAHLKNQRNFRFSPADVAEIKHWIAANLEASWISLKAAIHDTEVALIRGHTPLLNIRDNPAALPELVALRGLCREIAQTPNASASDVTS